MVNLPALVFTFLFPFTVFPGISQPNLVTSNNYFSSFRSNSSYLPPVLPLPTLTLIPTPTPRLIVPTPTPRPVALPTPTPTQPPALPSSSSTEDSMMQQINDYRRSKGLGSLAKDSNTCNFARLRASEITSGFNHDGFNNRISSHTLPYPSYSLVNENLASNSNWQDVVGQWINSPGHEANLASGITYGCVGVSDSFYAFEGWKP